MALKENKFEIVGTLVEVKSFSTLDSGALAVTFIVKSDYKGEEHLNEINMICNQKTKAGKVNSSYAFLEGMNDNIGMKVRVLGSIESRRFWSTKDNSLRNALKYRASFVAQARKEVEDEISFMYEGFVISPLTEMLDKEGNLLFYKMGIAQEIYKEGEMQIVEFQVAVDNVKAVEYISENYLVGTTVSVNGILRNVATTKTIEVETAFGEPNIKTVISNDRKALIVSGLPPMEEGAYTEEQAQALINNYKAAAVEIQEKAKMESTSISAPATSTKKTPSDILKGVGKAPAGFSL